MSDYPSDPKYNVFLNQGDGSFKLGYTGRRTGIRFMHLSGVADFDMDGALDIFALGEVNENKFPQPDGVSILSIVPVDEQGRQSEFGATIRLRNNCNSQIQTRVIGGNHVYLAQGQYEAHFAVASNCTYEIDVAFVKRAGAERQVVTIPYNPSLEEALRVLVSRNYYRKQPYSGYQYLLPSIRK
jgi:hypothetical protein